MREQRGRIPTSAKVVLGVIGGMAVLLGGCFGVLKWYTTSGIRSGEGQLDTFGIPVTQVHYEGEVNSSGTDLCYAASCTTVTRTYSMRTFQRLSTVQTEIVNRMRQLGYHVERVVFTATNEENDIPPAWRFAFSIAGGRGSKSVGATIYLGGVDPAYVPRLGHPQYSPYGGVTSTDVPTPPGDPFVTQLDLSASG